MLNAIGRVPARAPLLSNSQPIIREAARIAFAPTGLTAKRSTFHHHQLPEIGAGGAFRHLVHNLEPERVTELTTNRRQVEAWERDALGKLTPIEYELVMT